MPNVVAKSDSFLRDIVEALKQLVQVAKGNVAVGTKPRLNFIQGDNVNLTVLDNPQTRSIDITMAVPSTAGGTLTDGDKGDITVTGSGTIWEIDPDVVGNIELRNSSGNSVIGRSANTTGNPGDIIATSPGLPLRLNAGTLDFGTIPQSSVIDLVADLAGKVPITRTISTTAPLTGGGDLSANRTFAVTDFVASGASHARGTVPTPGVTAGIQRFLREDATWAVPTTPQYPRLSFYHPIDSSSTRQLADKNCYAYYYGKAGVILTGVTVRFEVTTAIAGTGWAEIGIYQGNITPGSAPTLDRLGYIDIFTAVGSTGIKTVGTTLVTPSNFDGDIWLVWASDASVLEPTIRASVVTINDISQGCLINTGGGIRPSTSTPITTLTPDAASTVAVAALLSL